MVLRPLRSLSTQLYCDRGFEGKMQEFRTKSEEISFSHNVPGAIYVLKMDARMGQPSWAVTENKMKTIVTVMACHTVLCPL